MHCQQGREHRPLSKYAVGLAKENIKIRKLLETQDVVLLDYNLNPDNADKSKPLSHAELIKMYLEGRYPEE